MRVTEIYYGPKRYPACPGCKSRVGPRPGTVSCASCGARAKMVPYDHFHNREGRIEVEVNGRTVEASMVATDYVPAAFVMRDLRASIMRELEHHLFGK